MLKETEAEETIGFFDTFLSLVAFQLGGGEAGPLAMPKPCPPRNNSSDLSPRDFFGAYGSVYFSDIDSEQYPALWAQCDGTHKSHCSKSGPRTVDLDRIHAWTFFLSFFLSFILNAKSQR